MKAAATNRRLARLATPPPSPGPNTPEEDHLPFGNLTAEEVSLVNKLPSRYSIGPNGNLHYKAKAPVRSNMALHRAIAAKKPKAKKPKAKQSQASEQRTRLRSGSPVIVIQNHVPHSTTHSNVPTRSSPWGLSSLFTPSIPVLLAIISVSSALVAIATFLYPLSRSVANAVDAVIGINPFDSFVVPASKALASIPLGAIVCTGTGFYCPRTIQNAAFITESFAAISASQPTEQISLGNDFFDCLDDLRKARLQTSAVAHLITLSQKIMQFCHVLEGGERLAQNTAALAHARQKLIVLANAARVSGTSGVRKIVNEFEHVKYMAAEEVSLPDIQRDLLAGLSSAQESLQRTADHTLAASEAIAEAATLASKVAEQAHKEISRLRQMDNDAKMGLKYLAYGWTRPAWGVLQPGLNGRQQDRDLAGELLKELIERLDVSVEAQMNTAMLLQQCSANTETFNEQIQRSFTFDRHPLSVAAQVQHLLPQVEGLGAGLIELRKNEKPLQLGGPQQKSTGADTQGPDTKPNSSE